MNVNATVDTPQTPDLAAPCAAFAAGLKFADLPDSTVEKTLLNLYDTLACSLAGFTADGARELRALVTEWGGKPQAPVLWTRDRLPAPAAAWINGTMAHARDYDDTHDAAIIHVGVSSIPAALAAVDMADHPVSGEDFIAAVAAGLELSTRMAFATTVGVIESGFIYSSLMGYFGATVAASRVLGFDAAQTQNAMGIAYAQAAGGHQATRDAALTKRMHPGFAARAAMVSVALTQKGVRGSQNIFEGEDGLWRIYLNSAPDRAALLDRLGEHFHLEDLGYKPYPCCRFNHTAIDAAKEIRAMPGFDWRKVSEVRVYSNRQCQSAVGTPLEIRQAPQTLVQAQFSSPYNIACALINGEVSLADFSDVSALSRPDIQTLTAKVTPLVDETIERDWGRNVSPSRVEAVVDGKTFSAQVDQPKGSKDLPMTRSEMRRKLEDCLATGGFSPELADAFETTIEGLPASRDVAADIRALMDKVGS
ncbi:MmgE/PrpD family protein [Antarctobacter sp.]|uniref:MmgE/PrpD family protein n=1 Tax=Antarctobacter sp. TaxID=1872577 RepID=UPI003A8DA831